MNPEKTGYLTTEFWIALLGKLLPILIGAGFLSQSRGQELTALVPQAVVGLGAIWAIVRMAEGYIKSRTAVKTAALEQPKLPEPKKPEPSSAPDPRAGLISVC